MGQGSQPGYSQEVMVAVCCHLAQAEAASHKSQTHTRARTHKGSGYIGCTASWHGDRVDVRMTEQRFSLTPRFKFRGTDFET